MPSVKILILNTFCWFRVGTITRIQVQSDLRIEIKEKQADEAAIIEKLQTIFNNKITVKNRAQLNEALYKMLNTENIAVYFTLVIVAFQPYWRTNHDDSWQKSELKNTFNLGTEIKDLRKIFLLQGTLLSVFGGIIGLLLEL
jgi:lipoprotein-releasing system permease protein